MSKKKNNPKFPIAIVGIGCRYPGKANDPESYWDLLINKVDAISEIPPERWNLDKFYSDNPKMEGKSYTKWGGFVEDVDLFDPECFSISPREAEFMDPQQRLILEVSMDALLDGGQKIEDYSGSNTGVFVGLSTNDYAQVQACLNEPQQTAPHSVTGSALSIVANRVSYSFNLKGPSMIVDTACSSSLVAANLACNSIWSGECDAAFAGGVNLILLPNAFISFCAATMLSPDGRCKAFDASANGFVRGEGAGMVLLKPLQRAVADGDSIYAVIKGSTVNHDGRTPGLPLPGIEAQKELIKAVYAEAAIAREKVFYIEAHGTGTPIGDPVEGNALGEMLGANRPTDEKCLIGSVKTNIGHLEGGAGIAALIKAALCIKKRTIPANLHFVSPNPEIDFDKLNLAVVTEPVNFPEESPNETVIGVNSFGIGGTNAHLILSEYNKPGKSGPVLLQEDKEPFNLLPLSARSPEGLQTLARNYLAYFDSELTPPLNDICFSASQHRPHYQHRLTLTGSNEADFKEQLSVFLKNETRPGMSLGQVRRKASNKLAFVFSGQGPQWWAMGRQLLEKEPIFRAKVKECDRLFRAFSDWSLWAELCANEENSKVSETSISQPLIFTLQVALAALWQAKGIVPDAIVGHSVGEVAAAHIAGAFDLSTALKVICFRGSCMDFADSSGRMAAVGLGVEEIEKIIKPYFGKVSISAINSPTSVTLAGDEKSLTEISEKMVQDDIFFRFLVVQYAFHSARMDAVEEPLLSALAEIPLTPLKVPIYSTVSGKLVGENCFGTDYWWRNVREKVSFGPAVENLLADGFDTFLEIGPHPVLATSIYECAGPDKPVVLPSLRRKEDERLTFFGSLGTLQSFGYPLDWNQVNVAGSRFCKIPGYPWQRQAYWHESSVWAEQRMGQVLHPLLLVRAESADPCWYTVIDSDLLSYLSDHRVRQKIVFPAAAYLEMALAAGRHLLPEENIVLENIQFRKALFINEESCPTIQLSFISDDASFKVRSSTSVYDDLWNSHCTGYIRSRPALAASSLYDSPSLIQLQETITEAVSTEKFYGALENLGLNYGPLFCGVTKLFQSSGQALAEISLPEPLHKAATAYIFHPALLDASIQTVFQAAFKTHSDSMTGNLYLPVEVEELRFHKAMENQVWVHSNLKIANQKVLVADIRIYAPSGELLLELTGFRCQAVEGLSSSRGWEDFRYSWQWQPSCNPASSRLEIDYLSKNNDLVEVMREEADKNGRFFERHLRTPAYLELEKLAINYICNAMHEFGCESQSNFKTVSEWAEQLGITKAYQKQLGNFFNILTGAGYIENKGPDLWRFLSSPPRVNLQEHESSALLNYPMVFAETSLLRSFGPHLVSIMRGEKDPLQLLFPDGSTDAAEHFYLDSSLFQGCNRMVEKVVESISQSLPAGRTLRILEVGAGTGSLTSNLLSHLPQGRVEYCFTDISTFFFTRAEQKFADYPFVSFKSFNIEEEFSKQGFQAHSYDLILASDVIHATRDLEETLNHLQGLLTSRGLLLFIEPFENIAWVEMIFGMFDGWWRFVDHKRRPNGPLLSSENWKKLLQDCGFTFVEVVSQFPDDPDYCHQVIMAQGPRRSEPVAKIAVSEDSDAEAAAGTWIIYKDTSGVAEELALFLQEKGDSCFMLHPNLTLDNHNSLDFCEVSQLHQVLTELEDDSAVTLLYLASLDYAAPEKLGLRAFEESEDVGVHTLIELLKSFQDEELLSRISRTIIVTRGAQPFALTADKMAIAQSSVIGLARVIQNELPDISCKSIDLDPEAPAVLTLSAEIFEQDDEDEVVIRSGNRYVPRLQNAEKNVKIISRENNADFPPFKLEVAGAGSINNLHFQEITTPVLQPDEVEITVFAASLNFRDVMKTLGLYPEGDGNDWQLGDECAGVISAIGSAVTNFKLGDEVVTIASSCLGSRVITKAHYMILKPDHISFAEAVTIPIVFLTVYYALHKIAGISKGDRILIQAAAGGVGLAAIQVAQHVGAEVYATAGSPEKRALLRSLGVSEVMDSRSLAFADEIMLRTGGQGVDIVLNSLAGEALVKGIECLAPYGRFLELGKIDIYNNSNLGLRSLRRNISFHAIDLASMLKDKPELSASQLHLIFNDLQARIIHPLPYRQFSMSRIKEAFRYMAQGKHIGKVVISFNDSQVQLSPLLKSKKGRFSSDASYLITGGFGGFGLTLAHWIVKGGGRHIILASRQGAETPAAQEALFELERSGGQVLVVAVDVCDTEQVDNLMSRIKKEMPPLKGIFHTAVVFDDGIVTQLTRERFQAATASKIRGSWNLHSATSHLKLDYFILFSSISSLVGNPGQGSYVAANFFLDNFAAYRRALQLPATTINWGALAEVGFVARNQIVSDLLARKGLDGMSPAEAMQALDAILDENPVQAGPATINRQEFSKGFQHRGIPPRFSLFIQESDLNQNGSDGAGMIRELLKQTAPSERKEVMQNYLRDQIAAVLRVGADRLQFDQPLNELGMDSLMMVELGLRIEKDLATSLPAAQLSQNPSLADLADKLLAALGQGSSAKTSMMRKGNRETEQIISRDCLVPLRAEGAKPPLYCFHPTGGNISDYHKLTAVLPVDQPLYGIQSRIWIGAESEFSTFEEMVAAYTELIRMQQLAGPYQLLGFSFGGFLALAVAHELESKGHEVAFVGLVDCEVRFTDISYHEENKVYYLGELYTFLTEMFVDQLKLSVHEIEADRRQLIEMVVTNQDQNVFDRISEWLSQKRYLEGEMEIAMAQSYLNLIQHHLKLLLEFESPSINVSLVAWAASEGVVKSADNNDRISSFNRGLTEHSILPGDHHGMFTSPAIELLAEQLDKKLDQVSK